MEEDECGRNYDVNVFLLAVSYGSLLVVSGNSLLCIFWWRKLSGNSSVGINFSLQYNQIPYSGHVLCGQMRYY